MVVGLALFAVLTSLLARKGTLITFEMITIMQINYFSLAFLDSMNPVFSGLLPLRHLAGILNFKNVEEYLEESGSPNAMKGIYMFLNISNNMGWVAAGLGCFLVLGILLFLAHLVIDYCANKKSLEEDNKPAHERKGFWLYRLAFHFIGELSLSLIFSCLPLYTVSLFF
jgi:hypothetical protein